MKTIVIVERNEAYLDRAINEWLRCHPGWRLKHLVMMGWPHAKATLYLERVMINREAN